MSFRTFLFQFRRSRTLVGVVLSILVAVLVWIAPLPGLNPAGQKTLAITLFTVI